jgi:hypothetical protein
MGCYAAIVTKTICISPRTYLLGCAVCGKPWAMNKDVIMVNYNMKGGGSSFLLGSFVCPCYFTFPSPNGTLAFSLACLRVCKSVKAKQQMYKH